MDEGDESLDERDRSTVDPAIDPPGAAYNGI
jgi:hypothetical protein